MSDLIQQFRNRREEGVRTGVVQAVSDADGLDVLIGGGLVTGLQFLDSYLAPGVGDVVAVLPMPGRMFVLGKYGVSGGNLGANLLPNPGFEFGSPGGPPSSWTDFWSSVQDVDWWDDETQAHSSGSSARFTPGALADTEFQRLNNTDAVAVQSGVTYRVGAWVRGAAVDPNTPITLSVWTAPDADAAQPFGVGLSVLDVATLSTTPTGWTELSGTRTIPVGHAYMRLALSVTANAGHSVAYVYADDVSLREQI